MRNHDDPVEDTDFPNIVAYDPDRDDVEFPEEWGKKPTERDQAVIDRKHGDPS